MVKKREIFLFTFLIFMGIFFIYVYNYIKNIQTDIFEGIENSRVSNISLMIKNLENDLITTNNIKTKQDLLNTFKDKTKREEFEKKLSLFTSINIKYIYLLYKDSKQTFRFLLDGSKIDKANFNQKFDVYNPKYKQMYFDKKPKIIHQNDMENLYLTYLQPIVVKEKVIAIFSVDITTKIQKNILKLIKPIETIFIIIISLIAILVIITVFQISHYFLTRKKIYTDSLTNLYNRNYLNEISNSINLQDYKIAMLDLDRFKSINDTYGHRAGDYVLNKCSTIINNSIRKEDILIRYGGEEFLLFIRNSKESDDLENICERVRKNVSTELFTYDSHEITMHISIGVHENPGLEKNIYEAIKLADKMLYIAKKEGRNRVVYHNENLKNDISSKSKDIDFVNNAIDDNRVLCYFQPIYNPYNNSILKYEALVRIIDNDGKIISPIFFLPNLKHTNIHYKLTKRILSIIFDEFKNNDKHVSINMNFSDLINEDIETSIKEACKDKSLASRLTFEILESDEIENIDLFKEKIKLLHSFGTKVSIDDFGSGYSNFRAVLDIEANYLKIDGSLVKHIDTNDKDFKVVKSIINFAKEANMKTIAEFVHSESVYNKLLEINVDYVQGYYISEPKPQLVQKEDLFE